MGAGSFCIHIVDVAGLGGVSQPGWTLNPSALGVLMS